MEGKHPLSSQEFFKFIASNGTFWYFKDVCQLSQSVSHMAILQNHAHMKL